MKLDKKIIVRFEGLLKHGLEVRQKSTYSKYSGTSLNREETFKFGTSTLNILEKAFGKEST